MHLTDIVIDEIVKVDDLPCHATGRATPVWTSAPCASIVSVAVWESAVEAPAGSSTRPSRTAWESDVRAFSGSSSISSQETGIR